MSVVTENTQPAVQEQKEEKKPITLTPAPLPTNSPWKTVNTEIPVTSISIKDLDSSKKKVRAPSPFIKTTASTKWAPIKASIVVSGNNNRNGSNNGRKTNNKPNNKSNNNSQRRKKQQQPIKKQHQSDSTTKDSEKSEERSELSGHEDENKAQQDDSSDTQLQRQNNKAQRRFNNNRPNSPLGHNTNNNQNGFQRRRYHNNKNEFHPRSNHRNRFQPQQMAQLQSKFYPFQPAMMAVNNIARQLEYYLSPENLTNDNYLRSKLSNEGYVPLSLLAKFYRVVNMSFGGDANVILAALREIVFNENATVEVSIGTLTKLKQDEVKETEEEKKVEQEQEPQEQDPVESPLDKYFIRSKQWEQWIPETVETEISIENTLNGDALDEFMIKVIPVPQRPQQTQSPDQEQEIEQEKVEEEQSEESAATEATD
ncbi:hypothetical protein KAFR_0D00340 [Kazachstania africana CBS 2517]|uniref:HTH La-type RNA-binding domain-containing protein n=1 Tax=Kazachstania africana (strain ATCC 22294 / BCRC 22015 / CBS 2517 / CECT 1963 / NBRC 1671 / NRRL Y-8276) TaxID=1071382 RepID=H2ATI1_KAZAF|nr:hypothetical protein KAFR_0D00340 [Kazachstania africana CBS 2517]CCF57681.1 hypothetical protein KAFR_0D00340 [Kazachstania africana CBS 2517]